MAIDQRSTRSTRRFARALAIAAAPALLGAGLVTAGVAQAEQDPSLPTCSWPNLVCGGQVDLTPGGQTDLTPGGQTDLTPGGQTNLTPGTSTENYDSYGNYYYY